MKHRFILPLLTLPALLLITAHAGARTPQPTTTQPATQPAFPRPGTEDREFSVSPARADAPDAAPRDALWPNPLTYTRDNAATLYLAGMIQIPNFWQSDRRLWEMDQRLQDATPDTINAAEAEEYLSHFRRPLQMIAPAVHRPRARWDWPWREQGYLTLLPHLNQMRYLGNVLTYKVKLELSRDEFAAAMGAIRQLYVMGRHAGAHDEAVYVEGLIGVGLAAQATRQVGFVAERPSAPNLYFALLALPDPMFDPRVWVEMEHQMFHDSVAALYEPERMDEAAWVATWRKFAEFGLSAHGWKFNDLPGDEQARVAHELAVARREGMIAAAITYFAGRGEGESALRAETQRDPYPLLARYMTATMDEYMNAAAATMQLPYEEAAPRMAALVAEAEQVQWWRSAEEGGNLESLAPRFHRGLLSLQRLRQRIAAAIVLEALRDHAARHEDWPESLEQVQLYLPDNPLTGRPFDYRRDGDRIVLSATEQDGPSSGFEWRITLRRD